MGKQEVMERNKTIADLLAQVAQLANQANQLFIAIAEFTGEPVPTVPVMEKPPETRPATAGKDILTTEEAAAMLGCTRKALYGKVYRREIARYGTGRRDYFMKAELEEYMLGNKKAANAEIADQADALLNRRRK
jgi:excisionase family DNA binding protein